ncbi:MAG: tyrosine-type recombinase/integrase [Planctomycetia bacterium]|nr:tyrosine-type recombinase/integrase [Planctomycetia bacterium]
MTLGSKKPLATTGGDCSACPKFTRSHDLRHLFATRALESGGNPILVSAITGHKSLDMLRRYAHPKMAVKRSVVEAVAAAVDANKVT